MPTDTIKLDGTGASYHGEVRVTPLVIPAGTRQEVPGNGIGTQLKRRKTVLFQNTSTSGNLYLGAENVGYGASFGGGDSTTCSGIFLGYGASTAIDAGRARFYVFNREAYSVPLVIMEIA